MKTIPLTKGYEAIVDDADFERVAAFKWYAKVTPRNVYAVRSTPRLAPGVNQGQVKLHRFVLGVTDPLVEVDHRDHDGLNCTSENLRACTKRQNQHNRKKTKGTASQYLGVTKHTSKWLARININGKQKHLGLFVNEEDAARAFDAAVLSLRDEFGVTNFNPQER